jgi:vang-like
MDKNDDDRESRVMSNKKMPSSRSNLTGGNLNANDRFYEEYEYERRLRKRRARLMTSTEEAFTHIKRISLETHHDTNTSTNTDSTNVKASATLMDPFEAAQAVFTSIARDLRRYLRVTRQQPFFTRDSIVAHLANCLSYDMSPKSFLQRYLSAEPLIFNERALVNASALQQQKLSAILSSGAGSNGVNYNLNLKTIDQSWILICDTSLYQNIEDNLMLVLKQNEVSLMCTFKRLPRFNLIEDILDPKRNKFVLKLNSETTV